MVLNNCYSLFTPLDSTHHPDHGVEHIPTEDIPLGKSSGFWSSSSCWNSLFQFSLRRNGHFLSRHTITNTTQLNSCKKQTVQKKFQNVNMILHLVIGYDDGVTRKNQPSPPQQLQFTKRVGWIQYLPSFGGVRTFSQQQFFYREWIRKSFPVDREGLTVLKSVLPC